MRLLAIFWLCLIMGPAWPGEPVAFDLYLVRHAEKTADGSKDPLLTPQGHERARHLATWLGDRNIEALWSSDYHRTRDTVQPLADQLGLTVNIYDPADQQAMAKRLLSEQRNALIAGHSNTIPGLATELCSCPVEPITESEHDRLIIIHVTGQLVEFTTLNQSDIFSLERSH